MARVQALRAEAEAYSGAIASCAEARARNAQAMIRRYQHEAGVAAAAAANRLRRAHDRTFSLLFYVAYGESAPKTPSPIEVIEYLLKIRERAKRIQNIWNKINRLIDMFSELDPALQAMMISCIKPILDFFAPLIELVNSLASSAPECPCPFLGLRGLPFDIFPVDEGLMGVITLAGYCAGYLLMILLALCLKFVLDVLDLFATGCQSTKRMIKDAFFGSKFNSQILSKVIEYCSKEDQRRKSAAAPGTERHPSEQNFSGHFDQAILVNLILAADYLDTNELLDLTGQTVVQMIKGKSPKEIRETFNLKNDFTLEEALHIQELMELTCQMAAYMIKAEIPDEFHMTVSVKNDLNTDDVNMTELLDLTSQMVAEMILNKTPEEVCDTFNTGNGSTLYEGVKCN
ncbi:uncharacterized protein LOC124654522 [Lolium rigidum]|uniref:uncharacterized protein LOC124654522 n=1 Tax=Lolium rigidum TaxID=89674 RepID=UPI001F5CEC57|nr:uncharacterized protein LOC124654522 [Lolium rigidum]